MTEGPSVLSGEDTGDVKMVMFAPVGESGSVYVRGGDLSEKRVARRASCSVSVMKVLSVRGGFCGGELLVGCCMLLPLDNSPGQGAMVVAIGRGSLGGVSLLGGMLGGTILGGVQELRGGISTTCVLFRRTG